MLALARSMFLRSNGILIGFVQLKFTVLQLLSFLIKVYRCTRIHIVWLPIGIK